MRLSANWPCPHAASRFVSNQLSTMNQQLNTRRQGDERVGQWSGGVSFAVAFGIVWVAMFSTLCKAEMVIQTSGFLDAKMFSGKNVVQSESSRNEFTATLSMDGRWLLAVSPIREKGDPLFGTSNVIYMSFDGADTFYCEYTEAIIELKNGKPTLVATKPISERRLQSYASSGNYPFCPYDSQKRAQVLWLLYGLGQLIHESGHTNIPLPWYPARSTPLAFGYKMQCDLVTNRSFIPQKIEFHRDYSLDLTNEVAELHRAEMDAATDGISLSNRKEDLGIRKSKWANGDLAGVLVVETWTNVWGVSMPTAASVKTYASHNRLRRQYTITASNFSKVDVEEVAEDRFRPPILTKLIVSDSRFRFREKGKNVDFINYKLEQHQQWLPKNSTELTNLFMAYLGNPHFSSPKAHTSLFSAGKFVLFFLIASSAVGLIVIARKFLPYQSRGGRNKKNE